MNATAMQEALHRPAGAQSQPQAKGLWLLPCSNKTWQPQNTNAFKQYLINELSSPPHFGAHVEGASGWNVKRLAAHVLLRGANTSISIYEHFVL